MEDTQGSTDGSSNQLLPSKDAGGAPSPPEVIIVDTSVKNESSLAGKSCAETASQARTPKHANKFSDEAKDERTSPIDDNGDKQQSSYPSSSLARNNFESRSSVPGSSSAFQPHDRHAAFPPQQQRPPPMQVSPGTGRYYSNYNGPPPTHRYGPPPPHHHHHPYDHHHYQGPPPPSLANNYQQHQHQHRPPYGGGQPPPSHHGPPPHMYAGQQPQQHQQYQNYETAGPSWGVPHPPSFSASGGPPPHARPPPPVYPHGANMMMMQEPPYSRSSAAAAAVSRAVSSSFDRSVEKGQQQHHHHRQQHPMDVSPHLGPLIMHSHSTSNDQASLSGDASWGQLNQVTSVDEDEMRRRLARNGKHHNHSDDHSEQGSKEVALMRAHSNSSSLTNSPTEGIEKMELKKAKLATSLESLSATGETTTAKGLKRDSASRKTFSPNNASDGSLDLMKCGSGSSGLLLPNHERHDTHFSFASASETAPGKRPHDGDEVREEMDTKDDGDDTEIRKAPSDEIRQSTKKVRLDNDGKKTSPLSIECTPPSSPNKQKQDAKIIKSPHTSTLFSKEPTSATIDSFYGKPPSYTYSLESAPPIPRHPGASLSRPGSSASTMTPMNVEGGSDARQPVVGQIPSWEIAPQDSFGAVSAGNGLMSSFSFTQDYPMLGASASHDQGPTGNHLNLAPPPPSQQHHNMHSHQALESRNQSFDGGHYHGGFPRSDSMMSYDGHPPTYEGRGPGYQGSYPPHAPSWGSAGSYHGYGPGQYQNYPPPMMRNYSEDSGRTSPPHGGPPGMRMMHQHGRQFQPPPEFRAPPSMVAKSGPHRPTHILSSPYEGKSSSFGWNKEEDMRLTEIMKKYKNPRDWEPIAKELSCGRSAKECHERWIRYLKPGVRKGQWTDHEDAIVIEAVGTSTEQPFTRWSDLAQRLPGRVGKQIRDRWVNHLNPNINHLPFARDDDLLLWEGHKKLGKRWVEISTKYFESSRSENHIKNRWYSASFKKFITNEFGPDAYSGGKSSGSSKKDSPSKKKKDSRPGSAASCSPSKRHQEDSALLELEAV